MRKFYSLVLSALVAMPLAVNAQTMTEENETLANYKDGYRLETDVNFVGSAVNGEPITPATGLQFNGQTDYKINGTALDKVTNTGLEFLAVHTMKNNIGWSEGKALSSSSNERWISISNLRVGQILVFEVSDASRFMVNSGGVDKNTANWDDVPVDPLIAQPISDEIHELQELAAGQEESQEGGDAQEGGADSFVYYEVINEGPLYINFKGGKVNGTATPNYLSRFQIWSPNGEDEVVAAPTFEVAETNGSAREIIFKTSPSTYGNPVYVFYSVDGEMPIALTEEGLLDVENTFGSLDDIPDGYIGDGMPSESGVYVHVDANDDESSDGVEDNIVTVKAVAVSSTGVISEIVDLKVDVSYIQLNAPTLTLVGFDGTERLYKVNWTSNVGNDVEYTVTYEADGNSAVEISVGDVISFSQNVVVTVSAGNAYEDGVCTQDADVPGIVFKRKFNPGTNEQQEPLHDWDFQNLTEEVSSMINGQVIDHYAILGDNGEELEIFTIEQYENNEYPEGAELKPIQKYFGWDALDARDGGRFWRTEIVTYVLDGEGIPTTTRESAVYADEQTGIFHDLVVDNSHPSYSTIAIYAVPGNNKGLYFMSRGTINVQPVQYGEYVVLNTNGGTTVTKSEASATGCELSIGQSVYVYNIDIYTYDELPEVPEELVAVEGIAAKTAKSRGTYNVAGQRVNAGYKGFVIKNGRVVYQK
jgi:hypothetical protein